MYDNEKQNGFPTGETSNNASQNQSEWNNQKQSAASSAQNTDRLNYESPRSSNQSAQNQTGQQNQLRKVRPLPERTTRNIPVLTITTSSSTPAVRHKRHSANRPDQLELRFSKQRLQSGLRSAAGNSGQSGWKLSTVGRRSAYQAAETEKAEKTKNSKRKQRAQTSGVKNRCGIGGMRCNLRRVHWYICCAGQQRSDYFDCNKPANQQQR